MSLSNSIQITINNDSARDWMRKYQQQKRRCEEENSVLRNICKRAKSDGMNVKAMIATIVLSKLDPDVVKSDMADQIRYMSLRRMQIESNDLFPPGMDLNETDKTRVEDDEWEADEAGYSAGRHGAQIEDCPYPPGTELNVHWQSSWRQGQAAIARELGDNAAIASTGRSRPTRKEPMGGIIASNENETSTESHDSAVTGAPAKRGRGRPRSNGSAAKRPRRAAASAVQSPL